MIAVFAGPSLPPGERPREEGLRFLPPVAQGDVARLLGQRPRPRAIAIIDGFFEGVPAVLHKEILWALAEGVPVLGAASMGALRAAELHPYGMIGVGEIFAAYRDGMLVDDDEVAVLHGPAEAGYPAVSEAMVNIRATLAEACRLGILDAALRDRLIELGRRMFYRRRSWRALLEAAAAAGRDAAALRALEAWLPRGKIDRKREDARALLAMLREPPPPPPRSWEFEWTGIFARVAGDGGELEESLEAEEQAVFDELRLDPELYEQLLPRARAGRAPQPERGRGSADAAGRARARAALLARLGLHDRRTREAWLAANRLDAAAFERLVEREARRAAAPLPAAAELLAELRLAGRYPRLHARAGRKRAVLEAQGLWNVTPKQAGIAPALLWIWYFEQRLGRALPEDVERWAMSHGFADMQDFSRVLLNERLYCASSK